MACSTGQAPTQWQTSVIIPIHKKGDKRKCTNYRNMSLIRVPGKVYAKCLEKKCREIVESKLTDAQCGFRPGRSTIDQIFALQQIFEKSWKYAKEVNACFVDLVKAYDRIPRDKLWAMLLQYGINGQLLTAIKSLYTQPPRTSGSRKLIDWNILIKNSSSILSRMLWRRIQLGMICSNFLWKLKVK